MARLTMGQTLAFASLVGLAACGETGGQSGLASSAIGGLGLGQSVGRTVFNCPGGTFFDTRLNADGTTQLRVDGATSHPHTLNRIVPPSGQAFYTDAEYRLTPGSNPAQPTLTPLDPPQPPMVCTRYP